MIKQSDLCDLLYVAANMRQSDRKEIYATRWREEPADVAICALQSAPFCYTAFHNGEPVAAVGAFPKHPGVWSVWFFATDKWDTVSISVTKFIKRVIIPSLVQIGAHRAECDSIEGHDDAHLWLEFLGAKREHSKPLYGKNRETFHCYKWERPDVL